MWRLCTAAVRRWNEDDAGMMAAAVAYYVALSLLPTLLIVASGLGFFLKWTDTGHEAHDHMLALVRERADPSLADSIEHALTDVEELAIYGGPLGAITLLLASLAIFAQLDKAFDRIYRIPTTASNIIGSLWSIAKYRLRAFVMLLGLGAAVIVVFCAGLGFSWFQGHATSYVPSTLRAWAILEAIVEVALNSIVFAGFYCWVPKVPVRWKHALVGGIAAALVWEIGRQLLGTFFIGDRYTSAYGLIGALTGIMLWGYGGVAVLLAGAEFAQVVAATDAAPTSSDARSGVLPAEPQLQQTAYRQTATGSVAWLRVFDVIFATCLLYVASFFVLRTTHKQELTHETQQDPMQAVIFSVNPAMQDAAVTIYRPLIAIMPQDRLYPNGAELAGLPIKNDKY